MDFIMYSYGGEVFTREVLTEEDVFHYPCAVLVLTKTEEQRDVLRGMQYLFGKQLPIFTEAEWRADRNKGRAPTVVFSTHPVMIRGL